MAQQFQNQRIIVLGFGQEGKSAVDFFLSQGSTVTVMDEKPQSSYDSSLISDYSGKGVVFIWETIDDTKNADLVIRSPGISPHHDGCQGFRDKKIPITSVTKLFFSLCPCSIIGVTGTKGKGTTATMIYEILQAAGKDVYLGGNIGVVPLSFLSVLKKTSLVVLELSSFQLMDMTVSPHIAVVLMVTNEHQDYHTDEEEYVQAKGNITRFQTKEDVVVVSSEYPSSLHIAKQSPGTIISCGKGGEQYPTTCLVEDGHIVWKEKGQMTTILPVRDLMLIGKHNWENVCAATAVCMHMGVSAEIIHRILQSFPGLPHRLQVVADVQGVEYIDDSFSTTPETTIAAIHACEKPKILILGGSGKNSNFSALAETIRHTDGIRAIIGIGDEWSRIKQSLLCDPSYQMRIVRYGQDYAIEPPTTIKAHGKTVVEGCQTMKEIIEAAAWLSHAGDVVLLSPGCASFGMFQNYKDRGDQFIAAVRMLQDRTPVA